MCPARMFEPIHCWLATFCTTPRTMPPANVPHSEPIPPMTTASKANSSRNPPDVGENVVREPSKKPASATAPKAIDIAPAYRRLSLMPISCAVAGSSDSRPKRPAESRERQEQLQTCRARRRRRRRISSGNQPIEMRSLRRIDSRQDVADVDAHVGGAVALQQHVLQHDADPEADEDARQRVGAEREVEDAALRDETDHRHHRHDDRHRHHEIAAERRRQERMK